MLGVSPARLVRTFPLLALSFAGVAQAQPHVRPVMIGLDAAGVEQLFGSPVAARDTSLQGWGRVRVVMYRHPGTMQAARGSLGVRVAFPTVALVVYRRSRVGFASSWETYDPRHTPNVPTPASWAAMVWDQRGKPLCERARSEDFAWAQNGLPSCLSLRTRTQSAEVGGTVQVRLLPNGQAVPVLEVWDWRMPDAARRAVADVLRRAVRNFAARSAP